MQKLIFYLFICFPLSLSAQINESDTLRTKASLSLTGFYQEGNVQTKIFRAESEVGFRPWEKAVFKTNNSYVFQEFGNQKADEDVLSLNFLYLDPEKKFHPFLLGFVSTHFRRQIDLRLLTGGGMTYQILESGSEWLKVSVSVEYEQTDFASRDFNRDEYDGSREINTFRGTIWISGRYQLFSNSMILSHESYYQPSLEKRNNYRWRADLKLELPIWEFLNFNVNYLRTFERVVIENQKQKDEILTFGFTVKSF
ncbi:MAG: DUF481 domain-containing protein [Bacteroidetes bacterium]|jgi:hypothetical protein|nr:DUF481 domain-containing protein [Bacteroidota bacterium]